MNFTDITTAILSHHPVQLLAMTVFLVHLARAVFWGRPTGGKASRPAWRGLGVSIGGPTGCSPR